MPTFARLKQKARLQLKGKWKQFALYTFLYIVLTSVVSLQIQDNFDNENVFLALREAQALFSLPIYLLLSLLSQVLTGFFRFGYQDIFIKTRAGMPAGVENLFLTFKTMPKKIITLKCIHWVLYLFFLAPIIVVGMSGYVSPETFVILVGGLFIPACWLGLRLSMVPIILLENPYTTVLDALSQSFHLMRGYCGRLLLLELSFIGWILLGALSCGIGLFWILPYITMTYVNFYYELKAFRLSKMKQEAL